MTVSKCRPRKLLPVEQGRQLLPTAIDEIAEKDPNRVFAEFIDSPLTPGGVQKLDFETFARAIDRTAWWMKSALGGLRLPEHCVIAYAGYPDSRYYLILLAAIKCGYVIFFPSTTINEKGCLRLLQETRSAAFLFTTQDPSAGSVTARARCGLPCLQVPEVDELVDATPVKRFPYPKTYPEGASDPVLVSDARERRYTTNPVVFYDQILHTSGSTGFPKPVMWTNTHLVSMAFTKPASPSSTLGPTSQSERMRVFASSAIYHVGGMIVLSTAIFLDITAVLPPLHIPTLKTTAAQLESWLSMAKCNIATLFPSQLSLAQDSPSLLDEICKLKAISYVGAPLSPRIADLLGKRVYLFTGFGSTELVRVVTQPTAAEDYQYIHVKAPQNGIEWRETVPGRYEMVHVRARQGPAEDELHQPQFVFLTYPDLEEYSSRDLFSKHPTKPDHWKYEGRMDESVVLSIGQNVIPKAFEERLERHPAVRSATVLGNDRPCVCLLLELEQEKDGSECTPGEMLEQEIWPAIQRASEGMRAYEQVQRSMIVLARPEKPVPRNFKGAVNRGEAWELYQAEIEACYARLLD